MQDTGLYQTQHLAGGRGEAREARQCADRAAPRHAMILVSVTISQVQIPTHI